jgi:hypothetical protein
MNKKKITMSITAGIAVVILPIEGQGRLAFFSLPHTCKGEKEEGGKFVPRECHWR